MSSVAYQHVKKSHTLPKLYTKNHNEVHVPSI